MRLYTNIPARILFATMACALISPAQTVTLDPTLDLQIDKLVAAELKDRADQIKNVADVGQNERAFAMYLLGHAGWKTFLQAVENVRFDEQEGSTVGSSGTTSLVSKNGIPEVLAFAVENGALTRSVDGTAVTFRGNLLGITRLATVQEQFPYCPTPEVGCDTGFNKFSRNVSFSFTFDTSRPGTIPVTATTAGATGAPASASSTSTAAMSVPILTGDKRQLSSWGFRYALNNPLDLRNPKLQTVWQKKLQNSALGAAGQALLDGVKPFQTLRIKMKPEYDQWLEKTQKKLETLMAKSDSTAPDVLKQQISNIMLQAYAELEPIARAGNPNLDQEMQNYLLAVNRFIAVREGLLEDTRNKAIFTFEYTNPRPLNQPDTSVIRVIYAWQPTKGDRMLTANFATEFYNSAPKVANVGTLRDVQLSAQFEQTLSAFSNLTRPVFSLAAYYQYMKEPGILQIGPGNLAPGTNIVLPKPAAILLTPKGNIGIAQAKLTFRFKDTGITVPFAATWSNRTELVKGSRWSANVGLSFDMDSMFTKK